MNDGVVVLTPSLTVTPETINVEAAASTAVIEYTVSNPVDGVVATATSTADWITITNGTNSFNLTIAENTDTVVRNATITVSYEGAVSRTVAVTQAAAENTGGGNDDGAEGWTLVTNALTFAEGDQIIIAAKNENYALGTNQKSSNRGAAAITKNGNTIATPGSDVQIITLKAGLTAGTWAFYVGSSGYLYAASSSSNSIASSSPSLLAFA